MMPSSKWSDYYMDQDFLGFWSKRVRERNDKILAIVGVGFDPRSLRAIRALAGLQLGDRLSCLALQFIPRPSLGEPGAVVEELSQANLELLKGIRDCRMEGIIDVEMRDSEGHNVVGRKTLDAINVHAGTFFDYRDVVVDISGMPRGVFFPLIAYLLRLADRGLVRNLHVTVVEDPQLDSRILGREYGQADYLHTFRFQGRGKVIWLPAIGTSDPIRLEKIHDRLKATCIEICPILPFPASSMRRADEIVTRHFDQLFDGLLVSTDDLLLCDERTPFDIYRKILEVEEYYRTRLASVPAMGMITTVVSPLSSKTLSLGMLLAAIERRLPVCHVEAGAYHVQLDDKGTFLESQGSSPMEIWLAGEPYSA